jgi:hypothetical protein
VIHVDNLITGLRIILPPANGVRCATPVGMRTALPLLVCAFLATTACANKKPTGTAGTGTTASTPPVAAASAAASSAQANGQTSGQEAAKRMTAEQLQAAMKTINASNGTLGIKLMSGDLPAAAKDAQALATAFADVERFFAQVNKPDAVGWAKQARMSASDAAAAATAGDAAKATAARVAMTGNCRQCHGTYREGDPQAGYRLKPGVL